MKFQSFQDYHVRFIGAVLLTIARVDFGKASTVMSPCGRDKPNGLYPHPTDCASFVTCADGAHYIQSCPETLHFNPEDQVCDWPENVRCVTASPETIASFNKLTSIHPGGRIIARLVGQFLKGDSTYQCQVEHGIFSLSEDCGLFVRCNQWRAFLYVCKEQKLFDPKQGRCIPENDVTDTGQCVRRTEFRCPAADGMFPDALDRTKYYNCWSFRWYHQTCPRGLVFNQAQNWCDYTWNIGDFPQDTIADGAGVPLVELQRNNLGANGIGSFDSSSSQLPSFNMQSFSNNEVASHFSSPQSQQVFHDQAPHVPVPQFHGEANQFRGDGAPSNIDMVNVPATAVHDLSSDTNAHQHPHPMQQAVDQSGFWGAGQPNSLNLQQHNVQFWDGMQGAFPRRLVSSSGKFETRMNEVGPEHQRLSSTQFGGGNRANQMHQPQRGQSEVPARANILVGHLASKSDIPITGQVFDDAFLQQRFQPGLQVTQNDSFSKEAESPRTNDPSQHFQAPRKLHINFRTPDVAVIPRNPVNLDSVSRSNNTTGAVFVQPVSLPLSGANMRGIVSNSVGVGTSFFGSQSTPPSFPPTAVFPTVQTFIPRVQADGASSTAGGSQLRSVFSGSPIVLSDRKNVGVRRYFNKSSVAKMSVPVFDSKRLLLPAAFG